LRSFAWCGSRSGFARNGGRFREALYKSSRGDPRRARFDERRLPSSSTTRAGDAGETGLPRSRMIHHVERCRFVDFAARAGSCTDASFSAVFRYPPLRPFCRAAQPVDRVLPSGATTFVVASLRGFLSPGGAPGVLPFAGFLPPAGGRAFLSDRAHVPLAPPRPPRFIFVGVTGRQLES